MEIEGDAEPKHKVYTFSQHTLMFFGAIMVCSVAAGAILILQFGTCSDEISVQTQVCGKENVIPVTAHIKENKTNSYSITLDDPELAEAKINRTNNYRLPRDAYPILYDLKLHPHILNNDSIFEGHVTILVNVTETCLNITLHAKGLTIEDNDVQLRKVNPDGNDPSAESSVNIDKHYSLSTHDFYVLQTKEVLSTGLYEIEMKFSGNMSDHLLGMFKSAYSYNNTVR